MDDKGKRYREEEFQRSKERLARFNQEMENVTLKPTPRQWIREVLLAVATGVACGVGTTFLWHLF
jgi:hypothetical protein